MISSVFASVRTAALATIVLASASFASAQIAFNVTVNTSALSGSVANPLYLDFQLNDGAGWGDGNNWATISNFQFGGGSAVAPATAFGGATGNLASSVWLTDSTPFNELYEGFVPGSWLSFKVSLSTSLDAGPTPDLFGFAILDNALSNIPTNAPGTDMLVQVNIDSSTPTVWAFGSVDGAIAAPQIAPVPEPSTYGLLGGAGLLLVCLYRRRVSRR